MECSVDWRAHVVTTPDILAGKPAVRPEPPTHAGEVVARMLVQLHLSLAGHLTVVDRRKIRQRALPGPS